MLEQNNCPYCKGTKSLSGGFESSEYGADTIEFFPQDVKYFIFRPKVSLKSTHKFKVCTECGCVWNFIEPKVLQRYLSAQKLDGINFPKPQSQLLHYGAWLTLLAVSLIVAVLLSHA
jgi:2-keto-3-deoxy-6-phosphogluconate aldolase